MGFFDHLFKSKSPPSEESSVETGAKPAEPATHADAAARVNPPNRADPSAFLHPKSFVPRGMGPLTAAAKSVSATGVRKPGGGPPAPPPAAEEIVLTLGDVLSRIPTPYLKSGQHDPKRELRFHINDLSSDIARGRAAVPLSRIAHLVPDIFVKGVSRDEDMEIRLPLQKLVEQIGLLRSRHSGGAGDKAARPLAGPATAGSLPAEVKSQLSATVETVAPGRETLRDLTSVVDPIFELKPVENSALNLPITGEAANDLKPSAEPPAAVPFALAPQAPVILMPPTMAAEAVQHPVAEVAEPVKSPVREIRIAAKPKEAPAREGEKRSEPKPVADLPTGFQVIGAPALATVVPAEIPGGATPSSGTVAPTAPPATALPEPDPILPKAEVLPLTPPPAPVALPVAGPGAEVPAQETANGSEPGHASLPSPVESQPPALQITPTPTPTEPIPPAGAKEEAAPAPTGFAKLASLLEMLRPAASEKESVVPGPVPPGPENEVSLTQPLRLGVETETAKPEPVRRDAPTTFSGEPIVPDTESAAALAESLLPKGDEKAGMAEPMPPALEPVTPAPEPPPLPAASVPSLPTVMPPPAETRETPPETLVPRPEALVPPPLPLALEPLQSAHQAFPTAKISDFVPNEPAEPSGESLLPPVQMPAQERPTIPTPSIRETESPESGGEKIQLSLAAILRQCPREILVGEMPAVPDSVRITLPFAPIDRQLSLGHVEISAVRFIAAIPFSYQKYFSARMGVKVPIPLEEVFQNLPSQATEEPAPSGPPLQILAPEVPEDLESLPDESEVAPPLKMEVSPFRSEPEAPRVEASPFRSEPEAPKVEVSPLPPEPSAPPASNEMEQPPPPLTVPPTVENVAPPMELAPVMPAAAPITSVEEAPVVPREAEPAPMEGLRMAPVNLAEPVEAFPRADDTPLPTTLAGDTPASAAAEPVPALNEPGPSTPLPPLELPAFHHFMPPPPTIVAEPVVPVEITTMEMPASSSAPEASPGSLAPSETPPAGAENYLIPAVVVPAGLDVEPAEPPSSSSPIAFEPSPTEVAPEPQGAPSLPVEETEISHSMTEVPASDTPPEEATPELLEAKTEAPPEAVSPPEIGKVEGPSDVVAKEEEPAAPVDSTGSPADSGEAAQPFRLPQIIRPFIVLPPPIFGFTPTPETKSEEETQSDDDKEVVVDFTQKDEKQEEGLPKEITPFHVLLADAESAPPAEGVEEPPAPEKAASETEPATAPGIISIDFSQALVPSDEPVSATEAPEVEITELPPHVPAETVPQDVPVAEVHREGTDRITEAPAERVVEMIPPGSDGTSTATEAEKPSEPATEERPFAEPENLVESPAQAPEVVPEATPEPTQEAATTISEPPIESSEPLPETTPEPAVADATPPSEAAAFTETPIETVPASIPAAFEPPPAIAAEFEPFLHVPQLHPDFGHTEILPPPALPLRRFDQDALQALFMTDETLDLAKISRLAAHLPGIHACVIATRDQACTGGTLPEGFDLAALLGLAPRVGEAAGRMPIGELKHFTLYGERYSISFFARNGLSLCAVHRPRSFVPGVREKLVAIADELSK